MFDDLSNRVYEGQTPESTRGLVETWILGGLTIVFMIYLFVGDFIDTALDPLVLSGVLVVGLVVGYVDTTKELTNERLRRLGSNFVLRFVVAFVCGAIGIAVAIWYTYLFGYIAVGTIGVVSASIVARTLLYLLSTQPS